MWKVNADAKALRQAFSNPVYYLDFEDERLLDFTVSDFNLLYEIFIELFGERKVFFFDEIQVVDQWETYVRRMYKYG
ncbi:AAA family ATPase [Coxiella burnetii]|uniref:AAA family ATPase n=1 Tax=Coxiella burnetii TaxID=777 RepID=UPI0009B87B3B